MRTGRAELRTIQHHAFAFIQAELAPGQAKALLQQVGELADLTAAERAEMMDLLVRCQAVLQKVMKPGGFNMGLNLGKAAGAGIPTHLHFHIVPRWDGDHNFMPVIADTRVLPQALAELWARLKPAFAAA